MVGLFAARKGGSGASSSSGTSSENAPLLNGSQEGPCYAYSYGTREEENDMVNSMSSVPSLEDLSGDKNRLFSVLRFTKWTALSAVLLFSFVCLNSTQINETNWINISIKGGFPIYLNVSEDVYSSNDVISMQIRGPFLPDRYYGITEDYVEVRIYSVSETGTYEISVYPWKVLIVPEPKLNIADLTILKHNFKLTDESFLNRTLQVSISTNAKRSSVNVSLDLKVQPKLQFEHVAISVVLVIAFYILVIFDLVHRTLASILISSTAVAFLSLTSERTSIAEAVSWIELDTIGMIFGLMILVSVFCDTGVFDYVAIKLYMMARGHFWGLMCGLGVIAAFLSAFMGSLTIILFTSALVVRLAEALNINPKHLLIFLVIFTNLGASLTPFGGISNQIIFYSKNFPSSVISFGSVILHMLPIFILNLAAACVVIRFLYRKPTSFRFTEPLEVIELQREIGVWRRMSVLLSGWSREEENVRTVLQRKTTLLQTLLRKRLYDYKISEDDNRTNLKDLINANKLRNTWLLWKSMVVAGIVIISISLENVPSLNISKGWVSVLGGLAILLTSDLCDLESILCRLEWSTLIFLASLQVFVEALSRLQVFEWIIRGTRHILRNSSNENALLLGLVFVLWIAVLSSGFFFNSLPLTTGMAHLISEISRNEESNLPLQPLLLALTLGACLGGNATLVGSSSSVIAVGVAEQHGYKVSFYEFLKVGVPVSIITSIIATLYLLFCHVWLGWNS